MCIRDRSYTTFKYGNVKLSSASLKKEDVLTVTFDLENTGKYEGTEVAQLYVQDKFASVTRPVKEMCIRDRPSVLFSGTQPFSAAESDCPHNARNAPC